MSLVLILMVAGGAVFMVSAIPIGISGYVDGEFSERFKRHGMDSYENKYVGPWAWMYDVAYRFGLWRQSPAQISARDARTVRNKARIEKRIEERRKKYETKENH